MKSHLFIFLGLALLLTTDGAARQKRQDDQDSESNSNSKEGDDDNSNKNQENDKKPAAAAPAITHNNRTVEALNPVTIGSFRGYVHAVDSDDVIILDEKTIEIPNFSYDGEGPASWFVVGSEGDYTQEFTDLQDYTVLPDENESCSSLRRYNGQTLKLTLPGKLKVSDIDYLSLYCLRFNHNFGYVAIPDEIKAPRSGRNTAKVDECENVESAENSGSGGSGNSRPRPPARRPVAPQAEEPEQKRPGLLGGILNLLG